MAVFAFQNYQGHLLGADEEGVFFIKYFGGDAAALAQADALPRGLLDGGSRMVPRSSVTRVPRDYLKLVQAMEFGDRTVRVVGEQFGLQIRIRLLDAAAQKAFLRFVATEFKLQATERGPSLLEAAPDSVRSIAWLTLATILLMGLAAAGLPSGNPPVRRWRVFNPLLDRWLEAFGPLGFAVLGGVAIYVCLRLASQRLKVATRVIELKP